MSEDPRNCTAEPQKDSVSIHFNISETLDTDSPDYLFCQEQRVQYALIIAEDLEARWLEFNSGSLGEQQERLKTRLIVEWAYVRCLASVKHGNQQGSSAVTFILLSTVPCILHMENRIALKLLTQLLVTGYSNVLADPNLQGRNCRRTKNKSLF